MRKFKKLFPDEEKYQEIDPATGSPVSEDIIETSPGSALGMEIRDNLIGDSSQVVENPFEAGPLPLPRKGVATDYPTTDPLQNDLIKPVGLKENAEAVKQMVPPYQEPKRVISFPEDPARPKPVQQQQQQGGGFPYSLPELGLPPEGPDQPPMNTNAFPKEGPQLPGEPDSSLYQYDKKPVKKPGENNGEKVSYTPDSPVSKLKDINFGDYLKNSKDMRFLGMAMEAGQTLGHAFSGQKPDVSFYRKFQESGQEDLSDAMNAQRGEANKIDLSMKMQKNEAESKSLRDSQDPNSEISKNLRDTWSSILDPDQVAKIPGFESLSAYDLNKFIEDPFKVYLVAGANQAKLMAATKEAYDKQISDITTKLTMQEAQIGANKQIADERNANAIKIAEMNNDTKIKQQEMRSTSGGKPMSEYQKSSLVPKMVTMVESSRKAKDAYDALEKAIQKTNPGFSWDTYNGEKINLPGANVPGFGRGAIPGSEGELINSLITKISNMAVYDSSGKAINENEMKRIQQASGLGSFNTESAMIKLLKENRDATNSGIRRHISAFSPEIREMYQENGGELPGIGAGGEFESSPKPKATSKYKDGATKNINGVVYKRVNGKWVPNAK